MELKKGKEEEIKAKMEEYATYRRQKQPFEYPSAGSTFKRGVNFITAKLIEEAGLKGYKIGDKIKRGTTGLFGNVYKKYENGKTVKVFDFSSYNWDEAIEELVKNYNPA